jgi:hypothetical protein
MFWYSMMISHDKEQEQDRVLSYLDYHASFINSEGVRRVKQTREDKKEENIKEANQFIDSVKNNEFKNNPLIDAIKKLRDSSSEDSNKESLFNSINLNKLIKEEI